MYHIFKGDGLSPLQYNMGEEITLLKIELDPRVSSVYNHLLAPRFAMDKAEGNRF